MPRAGRDTAEIGAGTFPEGDFFRKNFVPGRPRSIVNAVIFVPDSVRGEKHFRRMGKAGGKTICESGEICESGGR